MALKHWVRARRFMRHKNRHLVLYVDMAVTPWNQYQPALVGILTQAYIGEGLSQAAVKANSDLSDKVSAFVFNQLVEQFNTAVSAGLIADASELPSIDIDDWDGFPNKRAELLNTLKNRGDALILSGDIHAAFMTDHDGVVDFTAPAVSSRTFNSFVATAVPTFARTFNEAQTQRTEEILITNLDDTLKANFDKLKLAKTRKNGYITLTVDADKVTGTFYMVDPEVIASSYYDNPTALAEQFTSKTFIYQQNLLTEDSI